jgi:diguanylate cyclase (GGDEF)-like protein
VEQAERMLATAQREGSHLCLLLMDLDHFKLINDAHGHGFGDLVLKRAVAVCHDHLRKNDIFGRLGGEEFGILLPDCTLANVSARAEAIRITIAETSDDEDTRGVMISASLGVASTEHAGYDLQQLMADADHALYRAKRGGRNRVVLDVVELGERAAS